MAYQQETRKKSIVAVDDDELETEQILKLVHELDQDTENIKSRKVRNVIIQDPNRRDKPERVLKVIYEPKIQSINGRSDNLEEKNLYAKGRLAKRVSDPVDNVGDADKIIYIRQDTPSLGDEPHDDSLRILVDNNSKAPKPFSPTKKSLRNSSYLIEPRVDSYNFDYKRTGGRVRIYNEPLPSHYYVKPKIDAKNENYFKQDSKIRIYNEPILANNSIKPRIDTKNETFVKKNDKLKMSLFNEPLLRSQMTFIDGQEPTVITARSTQSPGRLSQGSYELKAGWINTGRRQRLQSYDYTQN